MRNAPPTCKKHFQTGPMPVPNSPEHKDNKIICDMTNSIIRTAFGPQISELQSSNDNCQLTLKTIQSWFASFHAKCRQSNTNALRSFHRLYSPVACDVSVPKPPLDMTRFDLADMCCKFQFDKFLWLCFPSSLTHNTFCRPRKAYVRQKACTAVSLSYK